MTVFIPKSARNTSIFASATNNQAESRHCDLALRFWVGFTGVAVLTSNTQTIIESRGLTGADGALAWSLAFGLLACAVAVPRSPAVLASLLIGVMFAGECLQLLSTAERVVASRDATSAPATAANEARQAAQARVKLAESNVLTQRGLAIESVSLPSCAVQCRGLLERQATDASTELTNARTALNNIAPSRNVSPLADRLGIAPWKLDLASAGLTAIAANGLACLLFGFATRPIAATSESAPRNQKEQQASEASAATVESTTAPTTSPGGNQPMVVTPRTPTPTIAPSPDSVAGKDIERVLATKGAVTAKQVDLAKMFGLPVTSFRRAVGRNPNLQMTVTADGTRLELVA